MRFIRQFNRLAVAGVRVWAVSVFLLLPALDPVLAQRPRLEENYLVDVWQIDEGLPSVTILSIAQTRDGYLWLGTFDGFVRFDGVEFKHFEREDVPGLNDNLVTFQADGDGRLWMQAAEGSFVVYEAGDFHVVTLPVGTKRMVAFNLLFDGSIWIETEDEFQRWASDRVTPLEGLAPSELPTLNSIYSDPAGRIWAMTDQWEVGLLKDGRFLPSYTPPEDPSVYFALSWSREGGAWILERRGLDSTFRRLRPDGTVSDPEVATIPGGMTNMYEDREGGLWIGTFYGGFAKREPNGVYRVYGREEGLPSDTVRTFFEDREGNIWVGTDGGGLMRLRPRSIRVLGEAEGLSNEIVYAVAPAQEGGIWIGTHGSGVHRYKDGAMEVVRVGSSFTWALHETASGQLWVGDLVDGLMSWPAGQTNLWIRGEGIFAISSDDEGTVWAAGDSLWRGKDGRFDELAAPWKGKARAASLAIDKEGAVWIGTTGDGLHVFNDGVFKRFQDRNGFPHRDAHALYFDESGALWLGAGSGLCRIKKGASVDLTGEHGLIPSPIHGIAEDDSGNFWFTTSGGILRAARADLERFFDGQSADVDFIGYDKDDGMRTRASTGNSQPKICRTPDGTMWCATFKGVAYFDPAAMKRNLEPPPVVIERMIVDGKQVSIEPISSSWVVSGDEWSWRAVEPFPPGTERFEIKYTAASLSAPKKVKFRYRLEQLAGDWIQAGDARKASFLGLPPGQHRFQVIACNNDGVWNETGATLAFTILPSFWQTWWFKLSGSAAAAMILGWSVRSVATRRLKRRLEIAERHRAIENERTRISRDMHDDMGARLTKIAFFSEWLAGGSQGETPEREQVLHLASMSRDAARALDELVWAMDPANDYLPNLAQFIARTANEVIGETAIRLRLDLPDHIPPVQLLSRTRRQLVYMVNESFANILKHADASEVTLRLTIEAGVLRLAIADDGTGIQDGESRPMGGNGLRNMRVRSESLGGSMEVESAPNQGTRVTFVLPLPTGESGPGGHGHA